MVCSAQCFSLRIQQLWLCIFLSIFLAGEALWLFLLFSKITQHWVCVCGLGFFCFVCMCFSVVVGLFFVFVVCVFVVFCSFFPPLLLPKQPFSIQAAPAFWDFVYQRACIDKLWILSPGWAGHEDPCLCTVNWWISRWKSRNCSIVNVLW